MSKLVSVSDYRKEAASRLSPVTFDLFDSGATHEVTKMENQRAIQRWFIRPRVLRQRTDWETSTSFLGLQFSAPIGIAPIAYQKMIHSDAECATVKAATSAKVPCTLSIKTNCSLEEIIDGASTSEYIFLQIDAFKDRDQTLAIIRHAEKTGCKALALGVDFPFWGVRYPVMRRMPFIPKDYRPVMLEQVLSEHNPDNPTSEIDDFASWDYVKWIKSVTKLPLLVKGILTGEDAELAVEAGADAIWISNHGGLQLDGVIPTIDALPEIVKAVDRRCEICIDGGFTSGSDIFKALALGANMVFMGRPMIWALACEGEEGVTNLLNQMKKELEVALALTGCSSISSIDRDMVVRSNKCFCN